MQHDCGHPSWPTLPARLSTQFFVTKMYTKKEGWLAKKCLDKGTWAHRRQEDALRGKNKVYVSANWKLLALVCKDWVLTCLVKMDDDRTEASGQLRAAALLIPMSVGSWPSWCNMGPHLPINVPKQLASVSHSGSLCTALFLLLSCFVHSSNQLPQAQTASSHEVVVVRDLARCSVGNHLQTQSLSVEAEQVGKLGTCSPHDSNPLLLGKRFVVLALAQSASCHKPLSSLSSVSPSMDVSSITNHVTLHIHCSLVRQMPWLSLRSQSDNLAWLCEICSHPGNTISQRARLRDCKILARYPPLCFKAV